MGYNIPQSAIRKLGAKNIRVYATAQDPFILFSPYRNKYHGLDPEAAGSSTNPVATINVDTPATWSMIFGINVTL